MLKTQYQKQFVLGLILLTTVLNGIGMDIYAPSLPAISDYFNADQSLAKLTVTTYILGFAIGQLLMGPLCDSFGRRRILLIGLIAYTIASVLVVFSPDINFMLAMRLLQGIAAAAGSVIAKTIASDYFTGNDLRKVTNYMVVAWTISPLLAPVLGGYLQNYVGWQAGFILLALYAALLVVIIYLYLPETQKHIIKFNTTTIASNYRSILTHKTFLAYVLCITFTGSLVVVFSTMSPFLIQKTLAYSPVAYGYIVLLIGSGCFVGSLINSALIKKLTPDQAIIYAIISLVVTELLFVIISAFIEPNLFVLILFVFVSLTCVYLIYPNCMMQYMHLFPMMGGSNNASSGFLTSLGIAFATLVASLLGTKTMLPLALIFLSLALISALVYFYFINSVEQ